MNNAYTMAEAAHAAGIAVSTLYNYRHNGRTPDATKIKGRVYFDRETFDAWIADREANPPKRGRRSRAH